MNILKNVKHTTVYSLCPVCWGYQEYDGKIRISVKDKQIDVNNHQQYHTRIRDFLVRYIDGIYLHKDEVQNCATCGVN